MNMNVLIVSPLFPPDVSPSAKYTKELCGRLVQTHHVTMLHFGALPERVPNVLFVSLSKKVGLVLRTLRMTTALYQQSKQADVILLQNGPSIELPALLVSLIARKTFICVVSDQPARNRSSESVLQKKIHTLLARRCTRCVEVLDLPGLIHPMIHPLQVHPTHQLEHYEQSWKQHLQIVEQSLQTI